MTEEEANLKIGEVRPLTTSEYIIFLSEQTEAGNALVLAGLLDDSLQKLLLASGRSVSNTMAAKIFDGYGPLSQFSARIDIAYFFELIDEATYNDLMAIKEIRNRFAHTMKYLSFRSPEIRKAAQRLSTWYEDADLPNLYLDTTKKCADRIAETIDKRMCARALRDGPEATRK